jgi:hypothetical protein
LAEVLERKRAAEAEAASLIHTSMEEYERDLRVGARLVRGDGSTLVERVRTPPSRFASYATRPVWPPR